MSDNNGLTMEDVDEGKHSEVISKNEEDILTADELALASAIQAQQQLNANKIPKKSMTDSIIELSNTQETERILQEDVNSQCVDPQIFYTSLEKLQASILCVGKHLDSVQKVNKEFSDFDKQIIKMNAIKDALESLANALKTALLHKKSLNSGTTNRDFNKKISKLLNNLAKEHQILVKKYKDKNGIFLKHFDIWLEFTKDYESINEWLESTLNKITNLNKYSLDDSILRELFNLTNYRLQLERTNLNGHLIQTKSNEIDSVRFNENLKNLNNKWKVLIDLLNDLKDRHKTKINYENNSKIHSEQQQQQNDANDSNSFSNFNLILNELNNWLKNGNALLNKAVSPVDELENEKFIFELREYEKDLPYRQSNFESLFEKIKTKFTSFESESATVKYKETNEKLAQFNAKLSNKRNSIENNVEQLRGFQEELNAMNNWITNINLELLKHSNTTSSASNSPSPPPKSQSSSTHDKSRTPSPSLSTNNLFDLNSIKIALSMKQKHYRELKLIYDTLNERSNNKMPEHLKLKMDNLMSQWKQLETQTQFQQSVNDTTTSSTISDDQFRLLKSSPVRTVPSEADVQSSLPPPPSKMQSSSQNRDIESISNDLFDWLLWIDHTLQSHVITVGDLEEIQQAIQKYNTILTEVTKKEIELVKLRNLITQHLAAKLQSSESSSRSYERFQQLEQQWMESAKKVNDRKQTLETMLNECKKLEQINYEFTNRILEMEEKVQSLTPIGNGLNTLKDQRNEYKQIKSEINQLKQLFDELKDINQTIVDKYLLDDTSKIRIRYERLVHRFNELSLILLNRGSHITEALQSIEDYDGTLYIFSQWLYKIEQDLNYLEDYCKKSDENDGSKQTVIELYKELQKEIDNHNSSYTNLNSTSQKIIDSFKKQVEKENLQRRIEDINKRWSLLRKKSLEIRSRLESNSSQWYTLINSLNELIIWCKSQQYQIQNKKQSLQLNQNIIQRQINEFKIFQCNVEYKKSLIDSTIGSAKLYYDDKRDPTHDNTDDDNDNVADDNDELKIDDEELKHLQNIKNESEQAEYIIKKVQKKVQILYRLWNRLNRDTSEFSQYLNNLNKNLFELDRSYESLNQIINENEKKINELNLNTNFNADSSATNNLVSLEGLVDNLNKLKAIQLNLNSNLNVIDEIKLKYQQLKLQSNLSANQNEFDTKYTNLLKRWSNLISLLNDNYTKLCNFIETHNSFGSADANATNTAGNVSSTAYMQLNTSVQTPWQRAISPANKIPYYINHSTETTSWDHPKMVELYKAFHNLNDIRFSAYRTAMKLRTLQKRLWLDLVDINDALQSFDKHSLKTNNERNIDVNQIIQCLNTLYQPTCKSHSKIINIVHAIDLTLNWLLSVYDPSRCGQIRVLSMKVAIVILCKGSIEEKYKYIFSLIAGENDQVTQRKLGLLLYEMIMIPKQLGEVAAFGGSNIEPSVRSCFEYAKNTSSISMKNFLEWLKLEPQSIVWLPVLHRLAAAETARHEAKCSICKEYPIVGFRYRSLKHFNFDICQNCFFSGRKIKGFKFDHPLLEYYTPTSSSDDIKDFFRIFRNKFRSKRSKRTNKLGYLPVQTVLEGDNLESPSVAQSPTREIEVNKHIEKLSPPVMPRIVQTDEKKLNEVPNTSKLHIESDDEHVLIAQYCQILNTHANAQTVDHKHHINQSACKQVGKQQQSQLLPQIENSNVTIEQQVELENQIVDLEEENKFLLEEYNRLRAQLNASTTASSTMSPNQHATQNNSYLHHHTHHSHHHNHQKYSNSGSITLRDSTNYLNRRSASKERNIIEEAKLLRQHENRLEARMKILENHNRLLDTQLKQLRQLLSNSRESGSKYSTISMASLNNYNRNQDNRVSLDRNTGNTNISTLLNNVDDITRAINNLNDLVNIIQNDKNN